MIRRPGARPLLLILPAALLSAVGAPVRAQQPALADLLAKAGERVAAMADPGRVLICDERYEQIPEKLRSMVGYEGYGQAPTGAKSDVGSEGTDKRVWTAEMAIFATPANAAGGTPWMEFRDVLSVNGKPVRDGASRLATLSSDPIPVAANKALAYSREAVPLVFARMLRVIELPRAAVIFLHPANQARFEFKKGGQKTIDGVKATEVKFEEKVKPTLIRGGKDTDAPTKGSFWIDPATGHVLMSLYKNGDSSTLYDELTMTYREAPGLGLYLPAEMVERTTDDDAGQKVQAKASFTKWRAVPRTRKN
jgi:hypothetical protein